jgi:hypothetical protein
MDFPHGETVTRLRGVALTDPYSGEATDVDWTTPTSLAIPGCGVADGGSLEPTQDARNAILSDFDVVAPYGVDVQAGDRLVIRGLTCEVSGRPFDWMNPFTGWTPGTVIRAKVVEG